ncbi:MAG: hypothetical protein O6943_02145 [Bacteroidetes bacterium]|nr:hypothetical protein [Bacteroidota bacterium]
MKASDYFLENTQAMAQKKKESDRKVTNEKPVSLFPLSFKEAIKGLLATKPPKKSKESEKSS